MKFLECAVLFVLATFVASVAVIAQVKTHLTAMDGDQATIEVGDEDPGREKNATWNGTGVGRGRLSASVSVARKGDTPFKERTGQVASDGHFTKWTVGPNSSDAVGYSGYIILWPQPPAKPDDPLDKTKTYNPALPENSPQVEAEEVAVPHQVGW